MKKFINLFLTLTLILVTLPYPAYADSSEKQYNKALYLQGDGTIENPYIITTAKELDSVRDNLSAHYKLGNDIDLTEYLSEGGEGYAKWNESGWNPIGNFQGSFDGGYHVISGLWINRIDETQIGLFANSKTYDGEYGGLRNLGVEIAEKGIIGKSAVGGLVGINENCKIRNCYVKGYNVSGRAIVGGLIGSQGVLGWTSNCYSTVNVISIAENSELLYRSHIGGLIGRADGIIDYSYATGNVKGFNYCGGLVGEMGCMSSIRNCYTSGDVISSGSYVGGIIGFMEDTTVSYARSDGNVQGNSYVGGIAGTLGGKSGIAACYSFGDVKANEDYAGGLAGAQISPPFFQNYNDIHNSYAGGSVEAKGEHIGAISGYMDKESVIGSCYRYDTFTINGNKILVDNENSASDKINGGVATETKLLQTPIINITLSETEKTDIPVTVQLNVADNDKIKSVSYVKGVEDFSKAPETGDIALANCDVDIDLLLSDSKTYSYLVGGEESADIICDYYINAGYSNGDMTVESIDNNAFEINQNGRYIICAENESGNKAFMNINIDNINSSDCIYDIKNLSLLTQSGEALSVPPQNAGFIAEVEVNKTKESDSKDYIFVAVRDKNGALLSIDYAKAKIEANSDYSFGFNIPAQSSDIGSITAFVWNGFNTMTPLAETKTIDFK